MYVAFSFNVFISSIIDFSDPMVLSFHTVVVFTFAKKGHFLKMYSRTSCDPIWE